MYDEKKHTYNIGLHWTGNRGNGTSAYSSYDRSYRISIKNKVDLMGSSDPSFRGDASKHNPEELFVSALSSCHMLWYLHLCANNGIEVTAYEDEAIGIMLENINGGGYFSEVKLQPRVTIKDEHLKAKAIALHSDARKFCFIANSCNFPVNHTCVVVTEQII